jgi:hypothetical protein
MPTANIFADGVGKAKALAKIRLSFPPARVGTALYPPAQERSRAADVNREWTQDKPNTVARPSNIRAAAALLRQRADSSKDPHDKERLLRRAGELDQMATDLDLGRAPQSQAPQLPEEFRRE